MNFNVIYTKEPEGGYTVSVPELPGCISYGNTIEEATKMIKEAIELYLETEGKLDKIQEKDVFIATVHLNHP